MFRTFAAAVLCIALSPLAQAQGVLERAGQTLDRAGQNIRRSVENGIARGQITAQENDLLARVSERIKWDKRLSGTSLNLIVSADNSVTLRGSVTNAAAKAMAVEIVENTVGVTAVVNEIAVVKEVKVVRPEVAPKTVVVEEVKVVRPAVVVPKPVVVEEVREKVITKP